MFLKIYLWGDSEEGHEFNVYFCFHSDCYGSFFFKDSILHLESVLFFVKDPILWVEIAVEFNHLLILPFNQSYLISHLACQCELLYVSFELLELLDFFNCKVKIVFLIKLFHHSKMMIELLFIFLFQLHNIKNFHRKSINVQLFFDTVLINNENYYMFDVDTTKTDM